MRRAISARSDAGRTTVERKGKLAFIGLGRMGKPIATRLKQIGYEIAGYDIRRSALQGFTSAPSLAAAVEDANVLITCLPDAADVHAVIDQLLTRGAMPAVCIDLTSSDPQVTRDLGQRLRARGLDMLDAPLSGGVHGAATGDLLVIVGGSRAVYTSNTPLLKSIGERVVHVGPLGNGHLLKALSNAISGTSMLGAAEILSLAADQGLDLRRALSIINVSSGRSDATLRKYPSAVLSGTYDLGFDFATMQKDMARACDVAEARGVLMPVTSVSTQLVMMAARAIGSNRDFSAIAQFYHSPAAEQGASDDP